MKNPLSKLFKDQPKPIPDIITNTLAHHFPNAMNVEWELKKGVYEAIFYLDDVEYIALISADGNLAEYKKNLWPGELPVKISKECTRFGETMNAIAIFRNGKLFFEVIVRDSKLKRKLYLFDETAVLIDSRKLWSVETPGNAFFLKNRLLFSLTPSEYKKRNMNQQKNELGRGNAAALLIGVGLLLVLILLWMII